MKSTRISACALVAAVASSFGQTPRPAPQITGISPVRAATGDTITLSGTAFGEYVRNGSSVRAGRCPSPPDAPGAGLIDIPAQDITSWTETQIKFLLPARSVGLVAILRADGQMSNRLEFEVIGGCTVPAPAVSSLDPSSVTAGSADTTVTVTGSNFTPDAVVQVDGTPVATTYGSATSLRAVVPAARLRESRSLQITVSNPGGVSSPAMLPVTPQRPAVGAVVNAASLAAGPVSAGEIVTVFGSKIGPAAPAGLKLDSNGRVASLLADTRVWFDETAAPVVFAGEGQVNAVAPFGLAGKAGTRLAVEYQGLRSDAVALEVVRARPGVFTLDSSGRGRGAILNQDGTLNSAEVPAPPDSIITLWATGAGQTDPPATDGTVTGGALPQPTQPVTVRIGGLLAEVLYAGAAPGLVAGVVQVNARLPRELTAGPAPVLVFVGDAPTQAGVTLQVSAVR